MTLARLLAASALAVLLTACDQAAQAPQTPAAAPAEPAPTAAAPAPKPPAVALDPEGVRLVAESGSTSLLAFGRETDDAVQVLTAVLGAPASRGVNSDCGAGPTEFVEWTNGFSALFLDGKFTGWSAGRESADLLTTMNGIGVGSTRASLAAAFPDLTVEESTLGQEFTAGALSGILDGTGDGAKVETIWAGTSCVFR